MTKEEAIRHIENIKPYVGTNIKDALNIAIKALKKEITLDEIKTEIKRKIIKRPWLNFEDRERDRNDAFLETLDIIDKYKVESEK